MTQLGAQKPTNPQRKPFLKIELVLDGVKWVGWRPQKQVVFWYIWRWRW